MRILITNSVLKRRSGTEIVTRDFALGLRARGHEVEVFTSTLGDMSAEISAAGIPVHTDPARLQRPDVIHANHCGHALPVFERFPGVPALVVCHDPAHANARSIPHPSIVRWSAVSETCRDRVAADVGLPVTEIALLPNFVDLALGDMTAEPLGPGQRWLYAAEKKKSGPLRRRLKLLGLYFSHPLDQVAQFSRPRRIVDNFPALARNYDVVFASARCAIEAAATGAPVIVCDPRGLAGFLTTATWRAWSDHNLGMGCLSRKLTLRSLAAELRKVNRKQALDVSKIIRNERSLDVGLTRLERVYQEMRTG